jgi:hypothetical protein
MVLPVKDDSPVTLFCVPFTAGASRKVPRWIGVEPRKPSEDSDWIVPKSQFLTIDKALDFLNSFPKNSSLHALAFIALAQSWLLPREISLDCRGDTAVLVASVAEFSKFCESDLVVDSSGHLVRHGHAGFLPFLSLALSSDDVVRHKSSVNRGIFNFAEEVLHPYVVPVCTDAPALLPLRVGGRDAPVQLGLTSALYNLYRALFLGNEVMLAAPWRQSEEEKGRDRIFAEFRYTGPLIEGFHDDRGGFIFGFNTDRDGQNPKTTNLFRVVVRCHPEGWFSSFVICPIYDVGGTQLERVLQARLAANPLYGHVLSASESMLSLVHRDRSMLEMAGHALRLLALLAGDHGRADAMERMLSLLQEAAFATGDAQSRVIPPIIELLPIVLAGGSDVAAHHAFFEPLFGMLHGILPRSNPDVLDVATRGLRDLFRHVTSQPIVSPALNPLLALLLDVAPVAAFEAVPELVVFDPRMSIVAALPRLGLSLAVSQQLVDRVSSLALEAGKLEITLSDDKWATPLKVVRAFPSKDLASLGQEISAFQENVSLLCTSASRVSRVVHLLPRLSTLVTDIRAVTAEVDGGTFGVASKDKAQLSTFRKNLGGLVKLIERERGQLLRAPFDIDLFGLSDCLANGSRLLGDIQKLRLKGVSFSKKSG